MRIGIVCLPERGGYYATFAVAKSLAGMGHHLVYFGPLDFETDVVRQGFEFATVFQEVFAKHESDLPPILESWWRRTFALVKFLRRNRFQPRRWAQFEALANRSLVAATRSYNLDLILVDSLFQEVIPQLSASGVPTRIFATELTDGLRSAPPSFSGMIPRTGLLGNWLIQLAWWRCFGIYYWNRACGRLKIAMLWLL